MGVGEVCNDCFNRLFTETEVHHELLHWIEPDVWEVDLSELSDGAGAGCPVCQIHLDAVQNTLKKETNEGSSISRDVEITQQWFYNSQNEGENTGSDELDYSKLVLDGQAFDIFTYDDDPASNFLSNRDPKPHMSMENIVSKIQYWFKDCASGHGRQHSTCQAIKDTELPPRLVEVSRSSDSSLKARLVDPKGAFGRYAALSYCWGREHWNPLRTKRENYSQHCTAIPIDGLAQTLQDAIVTTDRLGLKYVWMDALCIIQDSNSDKDLQISKMRSIFENSFVTLVAASGEHASVGFLSQVTRPSPRRPIVFCLPFEPADTEIKGKIYATKAEDVGKIEGQPIDLRAWTLEERLLSHRKVFFYQDRIAWECREVPLAITAGFGNQGVDMRLSNVVLDANWEDRPSDWGTTRSDMDVIHEAWARCIQWYTARELTHPFDKLRAIGGIAQRFHLIFHRVMGGEYFAGLWTGLITSGLLWRRIVDEQSDGLRDRPAMYRAPSWSWASIDGKVEYELLDAEEGSLEVARLNRKQSISAIMKPEIIDHHVELASTSRPFGVVNSGSISLLGMVKRVRGVFQPALHEDFGQALRLLLDASPDGNQVYVDYWPDAIVEWGTGISQLSLLGLTGAAEVTGRARSTKSPFGSIMLVIRGIVLSNEAEGDALTRLGYFEFWHHDYEELMKGFERKLVQLI